MNTNTELVQYADRLRIPLRWISQKNLLKDAKLQDGGYIINLQDDERADGMDQPGSHWVCFWIEDGKAVYFNSFGMAPPAEVQIYLRRYKPIPYNNQQIQNIASGHCGIYCIFFLYWMHRHRKLPVMKRFQRFLDVWSDNPLENLTILKRHMADFF
jgi:hypothetical protein